MLYSASYALPFNILFYVSLFLIVLCTISLDHSAMFGLKQGYYAWRGKQIADTGLKKDGLYAIVRHPLTSLLIVCLWSHPTMSSGRLLMNILFTAYAIIGTVFEEKDLIRKFGKDYEEYKKQVPSFIPFWK